MSSQEALAAKQLQVEETNALLRASGSNSACWWQYSASLQAFELLVGAPSGPNLVLALLSLQFLSGPTAWPDQRLQVTFASGGGGQDPEWQFELRDDSVGFIARSHMFSLRRDFDLLKHQSVVFNTGAQG